VTSLSAHAAHDAECLLLGVKRSLHRKCLLLDAAISPSLKLLTLEHAREINSRYKAASFAGNGSTKRVVNSGSAS